MQFFPGLLLGAFLSVSATADTVTLFKIAGAECGQASIDKEYEAEAIKFAQLKEGTCASQGFTVLDGKKTIHVPVIGDIIVEKFKKQGEEVMNMDGPPPMVNMNGAPPMKDLMKMMKAMQMGDSMTDGPPMEMMNMMQGTQGFGPEMASSVFFEGSEDQPSFSKTMSFPMLGGIQRPGLRGSKKSQGEVMESVTMYMTRGSECRQASINKQSLKLFLSFMPGAQEGTCASHGFPVKQSTEPFDMPMMGQIMMSQFGKAQEPAKPVKEGVTMYHMGGDMCGQTVIPKEHVAFAEKEAGLKVGTCASQGYTIPAGTQSLSIPELGEIVGHMFKKKKGVVV